ncbi:uncharacterized protein LOC115443061 [Manduca sexta]|uniref:uncharacterized protein LOC115443061 n=1 Tax=Manduca sexta TaxID=7130 RepID=UPI00188FFF72|nr:uncharacterized protein LOC115443061 [Manduca sexta]
MSRYFIVLWLFCGVNAITNMGIKLIILLGLLLGVLYSIHLLVQDYQALTAAAKFLRFLYKRDVTSQTHVKPSVRWKRILFYDPIQCARYFYCELGARPPNNELVRGFIYMLTLEPKAEDESAHGVFKKAYNQGRNAGSINCSKDYHLCPFSASLLLQLTEYLLKNSNNI